MQSVVRRAAGSWLWQGRQLSAQWSAMRAFAIVPDTGDETHDDFKPKYKQPPVQEDSVEAQIRKDVSDNSVFIYMKGEPLEPKCGFSNMACRILDAYGVKYGSRDVLSDPNIREGVKAYTGWPTIPQVFVNGEFIGGSDILLDMHKSGELEKVVDQLQEGQQAQQHQ